MKAHKLKSGRWRCQIYLGKADGKPIRESVTADTRKEAEIRAAMRLKEFQGIKSRMNVKNAVSAYIRSRESVLSASTIAGYVSIARRSFHLIGDTDIDRLTSEQIQNEINYDVRRGINPKTIRNVYGLLTATLRLYRPGFVPVVHLPEKQKKDVNVPTDEDVKELLRVVKGHYLELPVMLAAFGPMRRGEICALRSQNIAQSVVHVCENMVLDKDNQWRIKSPKTAAGDRFIEYPDFVRELWQGKTGRIVTVNPNKLTTDFRNLLKRNNLPAFRFHDLRHYSASIQHALGVPDAFIISRGGWQTDATLKAVYRHALTDKQKEMDKKINAHFERLTAHDTAHGGEQSP